MCENITEYMSDYFSFDTHGVVVSDELPVVLITEGKGFNNYKIVRKIKLVKCEFSIVGYNKEEINNRSENIASNWMGDKAVELGGNAVIEFKEEESDITDDPPEDADYTMSGDKKYSGIVILVETEPFKKWKIKKTKKDDLD